MQEAKRHALLVGGPLAAIMENIPDTLARRDAIRRLDAQRLDAAVITQAQKATRALQIQSFCDSVNQISARLDAIEKRRTQRERQYAAQKDAAEQQEIQDYLNTLPDPDAPNASVIHSPSGELHAVSATNSDDDTEGDLPETLLRATPPPPGDFQQGNPAELEDDY